MKIDESKIHWAFSESNKEKIFRQVLSDYFTAIHTLNDAYSLFSKIFEDFLTFHSSIGVEINEMYSQFYKEFDLLVQSDKVDSTNILIIKDGWLDRQIIEIKNKFKDPKVDISNFKLLSDFIDDIFNRVRPTGVKEQDQLFLQNYIVEIKIKLNQLKFKYENFTSNIEELKTIILSCHKQLQIFRLKIK
ncbi:hypothetical protein LZQ00_03875 [Sphingobacterium sp. SRCM116780]|uniref:hypothetical protein n=1 Tax=Sphingobacterium sp. SRCM116780 TaxID=2907623 RepID=UPI001F1EDBCC|nr:hypothetical protein [Sphingobacterium sp. SRCM116780]UIR56959.1 hypothetical protein LZQ00_03875 [Sphingobacterium sp. SRCM116780]